MRFTRFTDYALRVLLYVGQRPDEWVTIRQISDAYGISRNHLMKVVSFLGSKGYLKSQRGPGGGVQLQPLPADVLLAEVIVITEGSMNLLEAPGHLPANLKHAHELLDEVLDNATRAFLDSLNHHSLADLLNRPSAHGQSHGVASGLV